MNAAHALRFFVLAACLARVAPLAAQVTVTTGAKEIIYTASQRSAAGLPYWPDGNLGVLSASGGQTHFYAANSTASKRAQGTLAAPAAQGSTACTISGGATYNYKAGGPIYRDPVTGRLLLFYHAEIHPGGNYSNFYSVLGLAISQVGSTTAFTDCGVIVQANMPSAQADAQGTVVEMCGAPFITPAGKFRVYYHDTLTNNTSVNLSAAEASIASVMAAATNGAGVAWKKYYNGAFTQPGIGGLSSPLESGNPSLRWMDIKWNGYLNQYVMVLSVGYPNPDLYMSFSSDGLTWSARTQLENEAGESFYPTLVGTGADPQALDQSFYVYYTHSALGDFDRWSDAVLARRLITLNGGAPAEPNLVCSLPLNQSSGTTATDASGTGNHGTLTGQATWTTGYSSNGVALDPAGGDDYINIPNSATLENVQEQSYTLAAWFKPLSVPAGSGSQNNAAYALIAKKGYNLGLKYQNDRQFVMDHWLTGNTWAGAGSGATYATGVFHHVVGVVDRAAGKTRLFVNGVQKGEGTFTAGTAAREFGVEPWRVGVAQPGAATYRWPAHAVMDEVRIYSRALNSNEVATLFAGTPVTTTTTTSTSTTTTTTSTTTTAGSGGMAVLVVDYWMNERTGTTLSDSSGLTNNGVFAGAPVWTHGVQGHGLQLNPGDGSDDYVTTANAGSLENLQEGNYSVAAWFKPLSVPPGSGSQNNAHYGIVMKKGYNLGLEYDNQRKFIMNHWLTGNVGAAAGSSVTYATGIFHHVVGVVDRSAGTTRLYVNGALAGSAAFSAGTAAREYGTEPWRTGIAAPGAATYRWPAHGVVDEVQLYNGALTTADVSNLYANVERNLALDCWMDEGTGATAADHSGEGNDGTLTGAPAWTSGVLFSGLRLNPGDGTDDYVAIPNSPSLQNIQEDNYTLSVWFKPLTVPPGSGSQNNSAYALLMKKGYHAGLKYDNQGRFLMDHWLAGGVAAGAFSASSYATGVFHHVVGVVDRTAGQVRLYINGALAGSSSFTAGSVAYEHGTESWRIGIAAPGAATYRWPAHGDADEAQIYSRALSAGDVQNLYASQAP